MNVNINEFKNVLHKVYELSVQECTKAREQSDASGHNLVDFDFEENWKERRNSELLKFLEAQSYQTVKVIMAVMYIGRDYELTDFEYMALQNQDDDDEAFETEKKPMGVKTPIYNPSQEVEKFIKGVCGEKENPHDVDQIYSKLLSLDKYLDRAFKILGV